MRTCASHLSPVAFAEKRFFEKNKCLPLQTEQASGAGSCFFPSIVCSIDPLKGEQNGEKKKSNRAAVIWLLAVLFLLLALATTLLVYSMIDAFSKPDYNIISLIPEADGKGEAPEPSPTPGGDGLEAYSSIDLFKNLYTNVFGQVVAQSATGEKIIAPGLSNSFTFSLKNTGKISMDFTMTLEGIFSHKEQDLPFEIRLRSGNTWLLGDELTWVSVDALKDVEIKNTIDYGKYINYVLEWRWPYEGNNEQDKQLADLNDTLLSFAPQGRPVQFALNIHTLSTITEGAIPAEPTNYEKFLEKIPPMPVLILLIILILGAIAWVWFVKKQEEAGDIFFDFGPPFLKFLLIALAFVTTAGGIAIYALIKKKKR